MNDNILAITNFSVAVWPVPEDKLPALARSAALVVGGACLLTLSAKVQIPFWPVPMTMQTFVIMLLGLIYGLRHGSATMALYLGAGAIGIPVFAKGAGLAYMLGPTGGYLLGFMLAAVLMGWLGDRGWGKSLVTMLVPMVLGTLVIFVMGVGWLAYLIGWQKALAGGLYPFLFSSVFKIVVATLLLPAVWKIVVKPQN